MRRFDGEYRWFLIRAVPCRDELGTIVEWYGTNTFRFRAHGHAVFRFSEHSEDARGPVAAAERAGIVTVDLTR